MYFLRLNLSLTAGEEVETKSRKPARKTVQRLEVRLTKSFLDILGGDFGTRWRWRCQMGLDEFLHKTWNHRWKIMTVCVRNKWESFFSSQLFSSRYWDLQFILNSIEFLVNTADSGYFLLPLCFSTDYDRNLQRQTLQSRVHNNPSQAVSYHSGAFKSNLFFCNATLNLNLNNKWNKLTDYDGSLIGWLEYN